MTPKRRKMMLQLAEATLVRYERVKGKAARIHPPDFNALMMRICKSIVEERDNCEPPACCDDGPHSGPHDSRDVRFDNDITDALELADRFETETRVRPRAKPLRPVYTGLSSFSSPTHTERVTGLKGHCPTCRAKPGENCRSGKG